MCKTEILKENIVDFMLEKSEEYGEHPDECCEMIAGTDFSELYQAVQKNSQGVYGFTLRTLIPGALEYRGNRIFPGDACKIYEITDWHQRAENVFEVCHFTELWILEDMSLAVVSGCGLAWDEGDYIAEYREYKGSVWPEEESMLCLDDLRGNLRELEDRRYTSGDFSWTES